MATFSDNSHREMVKFLNEAIDFMIEAIKSGRVGFDYAIKEYVDQADNELSVAFEGFVQDMKLGDSQPVYNDGDEIPDLNDERRVALRKIADRLNVPEVTAFVETMIEAQDKRFNVVNTLQGQSDQLHRILPAA